MKLNTTTVWLFLNGVVFNCIYFSGVTVHVYPRWVSVGSEGRFLVLPTLRCVSSSYSYSRHMCADRFLTVRERSPLMTVSGSQLIRARVRTNYGAVIVSLDTRHADSEETSLTSLLAPYAESLEAPPCSFAAGYPKGLISDT